VSFRLVIVSSFQFRRELGSSDPKAISRSWVGVHSFHFSESVAVLLLAGCGSTSYPSLGCFCKVNIYIPVGGEHGLGNIWGPVQRRAACVGWLDGEWIGGIRMVEELVQSSN
jgi:hypothetical protein